MWVQQGFNGSVTLIFFFMVHLHFAEEAAKNEALGKNASANISRTWRTNVYAEPVVNMSLLSCKLR